MFNILKNKKGQSLVEYAIIVSLVIVASFAGTSKLYDAAKHNFYYGLLPTNTNNIELPDGPNGEHGWYNDDYVGVAKIECSSDTITPSAPTFDEDNNEILVYEVDQDQEIYCTDVSDNASRNSWGSQYKTVKLDGNTEKKVELSIWDEYGIKHSTYVLLKPKARSNASHADVPIAIITTQPQNITGRTFIDTDVVNVFGSTSVPLQGSTIDTYQWQIVDVGYVNGKRQTKAYNLNTNSSFLDIRIAKDEERSFEQREIFNTQSTSTIYFGGEPTATRYVRLRVRSNGIWSDWTQKSIKTGASARPRAVISVYSSVDMGSETKFTNSRIPVRTGEGLFLTYIRSTNPDTQDEEKLDVSLENEFYRTSPQTYLVDRGIIAYQWHLYKFNTSTQDFVESSPALAESQSINSNETSLTETIENQEEHNYGFTFKDPGTYCITLAVRNSDGNWSEPATCTANYDVPEIPNADSIKYFDVKMGNIPPQVTLTSSPPAVDGLITGTISTDFVFTPTIVHPEMSVAGYQYLYEYDDYQFGQYEWVLLDNNDQQIGDIHTGTNLGNIVVNRLNVAGTYKIVIRVADKNGAWSDRHVFPINVMFPRNYGTPVIEDYDTLPTIPSGYGTPVSLASDDVKKEIDMGFSFLAFGIEFSHVEFSSNGLLTFTQGRRMGEDGYTWGPHESNISSGTTAYSATPLSNSTCPNYSLAAYWTDLYPMSNTSVEYYVDNDKVIIEYKNHSHYNIKNASNSISFTIVIYSSGYIDIYYPDVSFDTGTSTSYQNSHYGYGMGFVNSYGQTTIGLKGDGSVSAQIKEFAYSASTPKIQNGQVLRFTPIE